jgi:hypothetical protein
MKSLWHLVHPPFFIKRYGYDTVEGKKANDVTTGRGALMGDHQHLPLLKQGSSERILNGVPRRRVNPTDTGDEQWTGNRLESSL